MDKRGQNNRATAVGRPFSERETHKSRGLATLVVAVPYDYQVTTRSVLGDGAIRWELGTARQSPQLMTVLSEFSDLSGATDDALLTFAERWGTLEIGDDKSEPPWFTRSRPTHGNEPIAEWRSRSASVKALLAILQEVRKGKSGSDGDWEAVGAVVPGVDSPRKHISKQLKPEWDLEGIRDFDDAIARGTQVGRPLVPLEFDRARQLVVHAVNWWVKQAAPISLSVISQGDGANGEPPLGVYYHIRNCNQAIAVALLVAVEKGADVRRCKHCGFGLDPTEDRRVNYHSYCANEGRKAVRAARTRQAYWADGKVRKRNTKYGSLQGE